MDRVLVIRYEVGVAKRWTDSCKIIVREILPGFNLNTSQKIVK